MFEGEPVVSRQRTKSLEKFHWRTDEEKRIASLGEREERRGTCKLCNSLHHALSNQEDARGFLKRIRERERERERDGWRERRTENVRETSLIY